MYLKFGQELACVDQHATDFALSARLVMGSITRIDRSSDVGLFLMKGCTTHLSDLKALVPGLRLVVFLSTSVCLFGDLLLQLTGVHQYHHLPADEEGITRLGEGQFRRQDAIAAQAESCLTPLKDKHTTHIMDENEMTPTALQSACFIQEHRRRCLLHGVLEYLFPSHTEFKLQRR